MRSFIAKSYYNAGSEVLSCEPFAAVVIDCCVSEYCACCQVSLVSRKRCSVCKKTFYCSVCCQNKDWFLHKAECHFFLKNERLPCSTIRLIGRCITLVSCSNSDSKKDTVDNKAGSIAHFDQLYSNSTELQPGKRTQIVELIPFIKSYVGTEKFSCLFVDAKSCIDFIHKVQVNTVVSLSEDLHPVANGIYLEVSNVNHSCEPNSIFSFKGAQLTLRTVKEVDSNSELFVSYTDQLAFVQKRQQVLSSQYQFTCQCEECSTGTRECYFNKLNPEWDSKNENKENDLKSHINRVNAEMDQTYCWQNINSLLSNLKTFEFFFADCNLYMHFLLVKIANSFDFSSQSDKTTVINLEIRILNNLQLYFPSFHPLKSLQYARIAKLYSYFCDLPQAVKYFELALSNLWVTHGQDSSTYNGISQQYKIDKLDLCSKVNTNKFRLLKN